MSWGRRRSLSDYVIHNVLPNSAADDDSDIHEQHEVFGDVNTDLITSTVDNGTIPKSGQFDTLNENSAEHGDGSMGEQLMQSPAAVSTSGQDGIPEESNSDSVLAGVQNSVVNHEGSRSVNQRKEMDYSDHAIEGHCTEQIQCSSSEENQAMPTSEDNLTLHGDGSPDMNVRSNYYVSPESIGDAISAENCKKNTLLSNVALKSEMLEEVELREAETKHVVSEASQAGNDILVKAAKLKKMSTLGAEENNKLQELLMDRGHVVDALQSIKGSISRRLMLDAADDHSCIAHRFNLIGRPHCEAADWRNFNGSLFFGH